MKALSGFLLALLVLAAAGNVLNPVASEMRWRTRGVGPSAHQQAPGPEVV